MTKYLPASSQLRQDAIRDAKNARLRQQTIHAHKATINKIMRALRAASPDGARVYAYGGATTDIVFKLDIYDLESFKDKQLIKALERIERASGVVFDRTWDWTHTLNPQREIRGTTRLYKGAHTLCVDIAVNAMIKDNSPGCKRVKVGERVHVEPVYEIQCE